MTIEALLALLEPLVGFDTQNPPRELDIQHPLFGWLNEQLPTDFNISLTDHGQGRLAYYAVRGEPQVLFNVHLDTVPVGDGWQHPPLQLVVDNERAYGRGSCDIKGAAACLLHIAQTTEHPLALLFTTDEEGAEGCAVQNFINSEDLSRYRQVIVAEPTRCQAVLAHRGFLSVLGEFSGKTGHSSDPRALTDNALHRMGNWIQAAVQHATERESRGQRPCFNLGLVKGGIKSNVIADRADLHWSARLSPGDSNKEYLAEVGALAGATEHARWRVPFSGPPMPDAGQDIQPARRFAENRGLEIGEPVSFWTEAALFSAAGIPALVLGPGDIAQAHSVDEWVALDQLLDAHALYSQVVTADG